MLSTVLLKKHNYAEAEILLRDTLDLFATSLPSDHQYVASAEYYLGEALLGQNRLADAEAVLLLSMNRWRRTDAPPWRVARSKNSLGEVLFRQQRLAKAEEYLASTFKELATDEGADREAKQMARDRIEKFYRARNQRDKLAALVRDVNASVARAD
jgi:TolA-binding protein